MRNESSYSYFSSSPSSLFIRRKPEPTSTKKQKKPVLVVSKALPKSHICARTQAIDVYFMVPRCVRVVIDVFSAVFSRILPGKSERLLLFPYIIIRPLIYSLSDIITKSSRTLSTLLDISVYDGTFLYVEKQTGKSSGVPLLLPPNPAQKTNFRLLSS